MKKVFALVSIVVLAFGLVGCGTSDCDSEDIAEQALDILFQKSDISVKELGARAVNIIMLDKEKNICQADIWLRPISEIAQEMNKDYIVEIIDKNPFASISIMQQFLHLQALRLMGYKVKLRSDDFSIVSQDGKKFDTSASLSFGETIRLTNTIKLLDELAGVSMHYQVTSSDKGEYIIAKLVESSGNPLYDNDKKSKVELVEIVQTPSEPTSPAPQTQNENVVKPEIQSQNENVEQMQGETQNPNPTLQQSTTSELNLTPQAESTTNSSQAESAKEPEIQPQPQNETQSVNFEQKFGTRIYLDTKDLYVNLRENPSGKVLTPIYKKDFADIKVYSFDAGKNAKWLRVTYFPAGVSDEKDAIIGYIHTSQIAK